MIDLITNKINESNRNIQSKLDESDRNIQSKLDESIRNNEAKFDELFERIEKLKAGSPPHEQTNSQTAI